MTDHLRQLGYQVREQPFEFLPSALNAFPLVGAGLGWLTLLEIPLLMWPAVPRLAALAVWLIGGGALAVLAWGIGTGAEIPGAERRLDANLVATRGQGRVGRWVVAHLDTKAQRHSMAGRLAAVWTLLLAVAALTGLAVLRAVSLSAIPGPVMAAVAGLALAAGTLALRGRLKGTSPGARDNGTGVLAALTAAEVCRDPAVGFLFPGAEEFGMVGARIFAANLPDRDVEVVNLDTLSDEGRLYLVSHDDRGGQMALRLRDPLSAVAGSPVLRRLPVGILTDSLPLARAGAAAVTVARLGWPTLRLMHTPLDGEQGLDLATAESVGRVVGGLVAGAGAGIDQPSGGI